MSKSQRRLGEFEQMVLYALIELKDEAYGGAVIRTIQRRTGERPSVGAVGTALDRMETRGLFTSQMTDPTPTRGGRSRKVYRLEPEGVDALRKSYETHRRMSDGLIQELEDMALAKGQADA